MNPCSSIADGTFRDPIRPASGEIDGIVREIDTQSAALVLTGSVSTWPALDFTTTNGTNVSEQI